MDRLATLSRTSHNVFQRDGWDTKPAGSKSELTALGLEAAKGNVFAYQNLVNHTDFLEGVIRTSKWICRHSAIEAEELLSEFFLRLPKKIRKYGNRNGASILSWSSGVLRHLHIDLLRRQWRENDKIEYLDLVAVENERTVDTADSRIALKQAFNNLTQREKTLIALRWREETLDDIVASIDRLTDPKEIQNRRPRISRELKAAEKKLQEALNGINTGRLQGQRGPVKAEY
ncbi:MAG: sigma-70 family RNA polymerase sigma factor [Acidobacteriota bacterium]|nr:MAG: sigma-70 family RNA polymerase sigma factor [Acidobacteriota bacterium]